MTFKEQLGKLKDNWLIIVLLVLVVALFAGGDLFRGGGMLGASNKALYAADSMGYAPSAQGGFAPEVEDRVIQRSASLSEEVERGRFDEALSALKAIAADSGSIILNENINRYGEPGKEYRRGSFQVKIPVDEYDGTVSRFKGVAKVTSFSENSLDVTGRYLTLEDQLAAERGRLKRYQDLQSRTTEVKDQLDLIDRIYDQERIIASLEKQQEGMDARIEYATLSITLSEERSAYEGVRFVKVSELVKTLVGSVKALLYFLAAVLPWALIGLVVWLFARKRG